MIDLCEKYLLLSIAIEYQFQSVWVVERKQKQSTTMFCVWKHKLKAVAILYIIFNFFLIHCLLYTLLQANTSISSISLKEFILYAKCVCVQCYTFRQHLNGRLQTIFEPIYFVIYLKNFMYFVDTAAYGANKYFCECMYIRMKSESPKRICLKL